MASLTLRKALRIKKALEASMKSINVPLVVDVDVDDVAVVTEIHVAQWLENENLKVMKAIDDKVRLSEILLSVRSKIEESNASGVNKVMSKIAHIDRQLGLFKQVTSLKPVEISMLSTKLDRKREAMRTPRSVHDYNYDNSSTIPVCPVSQELLDTFKAKVIALRKERDLLEEERLSLNNQSLLSIEIGDADLEFLSELGIG